MRLCRGVITPRLISRLVLALVAVAKLAAAEFYVAPAGDDASGNYFNLPVTIDAEDFAGLDEADLVKPRQPNGDLPEVPFLRLAAGSDAIDHGVDAGRPFRGPAPDLGAFESDVPRGAPPAVKTGAR
jgi:hypothetical protein